MSHRFAIGLLAASVLAAFAAGCSPKPEPLAKPIQEAKITFQEIDVSKIKEIRISPSIGYEKDNPELLGTLTKEDQLNEFRESFRNVEWLSGPAPSNGPTYNFVIFGKDDSKRFIQFWDDHTGGRVQEVGNDRKAVFILDQAARNRLHNLIMQFTYEKVVVFEMANFVEMKPESKQVIDNQNAILVFNQAVRTAEKIPGIVDMASPHFKFELGDESYFLWIGKEGGTVMNTKDSGTAYKLTKEAASRLYDLLPHV